MTPHATHPLPYIYRLSSGQSSVVTMDPTLPVSSVGRTPASIPLKVTQHHTPGHHHGASCCWHQQKCPPSLRHPIIPPTHPHANHNAYQPTRPVVPTAQTSAHCHRGDNSGQQTFWAEYQTYLFTYKVGSQKVQCPVTALTGVYG